MAKILASAVVILAALWLIPDLYGLENKPPSNPEDYDDGQLSFKESTKHGHSSRPRAEESDKNEDHKNVDRPGNSRGPPENIANWNLKRLLQYVVSLLHSINGNNSHESELSDGHKYERAPDSKNNELKTNGTNDTPRKYFGSNSDNMSNTEYENSGDGNNSEYYEEESLNHPSENSQIKIFKANMSKDPEIQNGEGISEDPPRNRGDNYKPISKVFESHRASAQDSFSRAEQVSDEFIDAKINRPAGNGFTKDDRKSKNNQSIMHTTLNESASERSVSKKEDGKLINAQHPNSSKIVTKMNITLNKGLGDKPRLFDSLSEDKPFLSKADRNRDNPMTNSSTIKSNFASNNSRASGNLSKPGEGTIFNFTSLYSPSLEKDFYISPSTSKIFKENSNSPKEIKLSQSKNLQISGVKKDMHDKSKKNLSILHDSLENQSLKENRSLSSEPQLQSKDKPDSTGKLFLQYQLNNTKGPAQQRDFNSSYRLFPQSDPIDTESRNNSGIPTEQHLVTLDKHPKPEEKQNRTFFNTSDEIKTQEGSSSDTSSDSSESSSSEESYEDDEYDEIVTERPEFIDYFKDIISNATSQTSQYSAPNTNYSMETELPSSFKNESNSKKFLKTQELFNTILEFLYKYSNNSLFTSLKNVQKNVTE